MKPPEELPLETLRAIDEPCQEFESRLLSGDSPRVEEFVGRVPPRLREVLLVELLHLEWEHRPTEECEIGSWLTRLPEWERVVRYAWSERPGAEPANDAGPTFGPDLERLELVGRGGMGEVWRVRDVELGRDLAAKVVSPFASATAADRLRTEARVTGQMQHPNIPPVHAAGALDDGRPYFTMKLVRGQTLDRLTRAEPARLLAAFEQVCQAAGYAHSQGVIHRDLKPANVMVGAFGEVQVMDWGLAKVLGAAESVPTDDVKIADDGDEGGTRTGSVMGTWAYMPPEQAKGRVRDVGRRSDVFALGAILCEILTGRPPYVGDARAKAEAADWTDANDHLDVCGGDPALIDLTKRCLAGDPAARPADGAAVAAEVADYRAEAQRRLEEERLSREREQSRAEHERKRRKLAVGLAVLAVAVVGLAAAGVVVWQRSDQRAAARDRDVRASLDAAVAAMRADDLTAAAARLTEADGRLGPNGPPDLRAELDAHRGLLATAGRLHRVRLARATWTAAGFDDRAALAGYRDSFAAAGLKITSPETAKAIAASPIRKRLLAALDDWAWVADMLGRELLRDRVLSLARAADPDAELKDRLRDPRLWGKGRGELADLADAADPAGLTPELIWMLGRHVPSGRWERYWKAALAAHPGDFWLLNEMYRHYRRLGRDADSEMYARAALAAMPNAYAAHVNLGVGLFNQERYAEAAAHYRAARDIDPDDPIAHFNLAVVARKAGRPADSVSHLRAALAADPDHPQALGELAAHLGRQGRSREAIPLLERAIAQLPNEAKPLYNLGLCLSNLEKYDEAEWRFRQAIAIDGGDPDYHYNLGAVLSRRGQKQEAVAAYRRALGIDPSHIPATKNLGLALSSLKRYREAAVRLREAASLDAKDAKVRYSLGLALAKSGRPAAAAAAYRGCLALDPQNLKACVNLAILLHNLGDPEGAIDHFRRATEIAPNDPIPHRNLALSLKDRGRFEESLHEFRTCHELLRQKPRPRWPTAKWVREAEGLASVGRRLEDILAGRRAAPASAAALIGFASVCTRYKRRHAEAVGLFRAAFRLNTSAGADPTTGVRYTAARSAVLAAAATPPLNPSLCAATAGFRASARDWLAADLEVWSKAARRPEFARRACREWLADPAFAPLRGGPAYAQLPAGERRLWGQLWMRVRHLAR